MVRIGASAIERRAAQNSYRTLLLNALGKESEPAHLIPSGFMTINLSPTNDFKQSHGVEQSVVGTKFNLPIKATPT